jgi:hypothetical protein
MLIRCDDCGAPFHLSRHRIREHRKCGSQPHCYLCRSSTRYVLSDEERAEYAAWWRHESGLSERELVSIARGLVPL